MRSRVRKALRRWAQRFHVNLRVRVQLCEVPSLRIAA